MYDELDGITKDCLKGIPGFEDLSPEGAAALQTF
jgi:hypothetical protein